MPSLEPHFWISVLGAIAAASLALHLASIAPPPPPRLGPRGARRRVAMARAGLYAFAEPTIRYVAGLFGGRCPPWLARRIEHRLRRSGYPLGLTADEYLALSLLSAIGMGSLAAATARAIHAPALLVVALALLGLGLPHVHTSELARARAKEVTRKLPHAIEIAAMCMGAGLDFPGALRQLEKPVRSADRDALCEEFAAILEEIELGHTRAEALTSFARRVPTESVRDFVNAVVQAEKKGSPLARVLQVQGRMLNMRRSILAEEAAARAGVLMIVPMVLLLACVLLLLMGPFLVKGIGF